MAQGCREVLVDASTEPQQLEAAVEAVKVPRSKQPGGYDCEFVETPPSVIQTECSICLQTLRTPKIISCCGHSLCALCIDRIAEDGKCCPLCNEEDYSLVRNKALERSLNEFEVKCGYFQEGCCWVGKLGQLSKHLNPNVSDDSIAGCEYVEVKCWHNCGDYYELRFIKEHEQNDCPKRPFSCVHCRKYRSTFEDVTANHYAVCGSYPVLCPNRCELPSPIKCRDLASHVDNDCDFHYAGCVARLPRKDMPNHLRENITHLSLMAAKLMEKDKLISSLTTEIKQRQDELSLESRDLKIENEALKQKIRRYTKM